MPDGILLDDGTSRAWIVFEGAAIEAAAELAVDDAVEVSGTVAGDAGRESVTVDDPAAIIVAGRLDGGLSAATAGLAGAAAEPPASGALVGDSTAEEGAGMPAGVSSTALVMAIVIGLLAVALAAAAVAGWRERERRRAAARVAGRLEGLVGPFDAS